MTTQVEDHLRAHPGLTAEDLAEQLDWAPERMRAWLDELVERRRVEIVGCSIDKLGGRHRIYVAKAVDERIGECEWCGRTDHHLVRGECPECRVKARTVGGAA